MARRPNFGYEKRQREIAKRKKKQEKRDRKAAKKTGSDDEAPEDSATPTPDPES